jgi:hypothetical protein
MSLRAGLLALALVAGGAVGQAGAAAQIVIDADGLEPSVLLVEPERQVVFVNRSGRLMHVEFEHRGPGPHQHHLVQVVDRIWAVFHRPGPHRYAVHFQGPRMQDLEGAVVVGEHPYGGPDPLVCSGITVRGACLER